MGIVEEKLIRFTSDHVKDRQLILRMLQYEDKIIHAPIVTASTSNAVKTDGCSSGQCVRPSIPSSPSSVPVPSISSIPVVPIIPIVPIGREVYAEFASGTGPGAGASLEPEYKIHRLVLRHFGFHTTDDDVEVYRTIFAHYYRSPTDYDKQVMQSVTYFRENKQVFYTTPQPSVGQVLPDARLLIFPTIGPTNADGKQQPTQPMLATTLNEQLDLISSSAIELADYRGKPKVDSKTQVDAVNDDDDDVPDLVEVLADSTSSPSASSVKTNGVSPHLWGASYWRTVHALETAADSKSLPLQSRSMMKTYLGQLLEDQQRYSYNYRQWLASQSVKVDKVEVVNLSTPTAATTDAPQLSFISKVQAKIAAMKRPSAIKLEELPKIIGPALPSTDIAIDIGVLKELNEAKTSKDEPTTVKPVLESNDFYFAKLRAAVKDKIRKTKRSDALATDVKELTILKPSTLTEVAVDNTNVGAKNQNPKAFVCGFSTS